MATRAKKNGSEKTHTPTAPSVLTIVEQTYAQEPISMDQRTVQHLCCVVGDTTTVIGVFRTAGEAARVLAFLRQGLATCKACQRSFQAHAEMQEVSSEVTEPMADDQETSADAQTTSADEEREDDRP
jgi:hypothetical protein